jgi:hypothetical protein
MKNTPLTPRLLLALLFWTGLVSAQDYYPAADFQPKVIYSSEAVPASTTNPCPQQAVQTENDTRYPAAYYQPKVIYSNEDSKKGS